MATDTTKEMPATEPYVHHVATGENDPAANYSTLSLMVHWLGAIAVLILFFTHEGDWLTLHVSLGLVLALPLIARVIYRWTKGFPRPHDQHPSLNFLARSVMLLMLISIMLVTITGILMPLFEGSPYPLLDYASWSAPYGGNTFVYGILEEIHDAAGHALIPLFILHILGFIKHTFIDKTGTKTRMLKPEKGGK